MIRTTLVGIGALSVLCLIGKASAEQLAAYDFDTNTGTTGGAMATDVSGLGHDVTLQETASIVMDADRGSMVLATGPGMANPGPGAAIIGVGAVSDLSDGADNSKLNTEGSFTMAAWLKTGNTEGWKQLFGRGWGSERIYSFIEGEASVATALSNVNDVNGNDLGFFWSGPSGGTAGGNDGNWHHYAITLDINGEFHSPNTVTTYYDGAPVWTSDPFVYSRNGSPATPAIGIGVRTPDLEDYLRDSYVDDAVYWNEAANPALIGQIAAGTVNGTDIHLIPEPSGLLLLLIGGAALAGWRRR